MEFKEIKSQWKENENKKYSRSTCNTLLGQSIFNPLNAELNPICHLLALLGAHHILHISRIRVKNSLKLSWFPYTYSALWPSAEMVFVRQAYAVD